jgi:acetyl-CoA synthetase
MINNVKGTSEVESAFVSHPAVVEATVIGKSDPIKGQVIKAFVILREGSKLNTKLI